MENTRLILSGIGYPLLLTTIIQTGMSLPNLALNGLAKQSSTFGHGDVASKAVDGIAGSFSHTKNQTTPWWTLDLVGVYWVTTVAVTNRNTYPWRLDGAEIRVGNSLENNGINNPRCAVISHIPAGQRQSFQCGEMEGRYVTVVIPGEKKFLILCEVEVYGCADPPPPTVNLMLGGRNVTLVGAGLCWSDALFYCRDHHWDLLSLTSRGQQKELEARLQGNISFPLTPHLWLGLRRYLMEDKWFWMNGDQMTYSQWKWGYAPPRLSHPCGAVANGGDFLWEDRLCEEHLNFLCISGTGQKDRVTFYSSDRDKPHCP